MNNAEVITQLKVALVDLEDRLAELELEEAKLGPPLETIAERRAQIISAMSLLISKRGRLWNQLDLRQFLLQQEQDVPPLSAASREKLERALAAVGEAIRHNQRLEDVLAVVDKIAAAVDEVAAAV